MNSGNAEQLAASAEKIYDKNLREKLEVSNFDDFVAIEPKSGDSFIGATPSEATKAAKSKYPNRLTHLVRIGHRAALHFGMQIQ